MGSGDCAVTGGGGASLPSETAELKQDRLSEFKKKIKSIESSREIAHMQVEAHAQIFCRRPERKFSFQS